MTAMAIDPAAPDSGAKSRHDPYEVNIKIMIAAVVVLFSVILFILALHLYAKWFWRSSQRRWRHHQQQQQQGQDQQQAQQQAAFEDEDPFNNNPAFGLDKAFLEALPTFIFKQQQSEQDFQAGGGKQQLVRSHTDCCAVCISEFQEGDAGRMLPKCGHAFHTGCIDMWLHCHTTCPLCRTGIVSNPWESRAKADSIAFDLRFLDTAVLEGLVLAAAANTSRAVATANSAAEAGDRTGDQGQEQAQQQQQEQQQQQQHLVIEIPVVDLSSTSSASIGCCSQQHSVAPPKSPKSRWKSLRRMLSRDRKVAPASGSSSPEVSRTGSSVSSSSSSTLSALSRTSSVSSSSAAECSDDQQQQQQQQQPQGSSSSRLVVLLVE